jgi:predicted kinase
MIKLEDILGEMGHNDVNLNAILKHYDLNGPFTKKKVGVAVMKNPNATREQIYNVLRDMGYQEIRDVMKDLRKWEGREDLEEDEVTEGVNDPGILKCIFLAGGPGSGKSTTASEVFGVNNLVRFSPHGLKVVSSDVAFEKFLKSSGIDPKDLSSIEKRDPKYYKTLTGDEPTTMRSKAVSLIKKQTSLYQEGRLGLIIDGTGEDVEKIRVKKRLAEELGYDCYMVFVNTSLEVAQERNAKRSRRLPARVVEEIWKRCQNNLGAFQTLFGNDFAIVDNTESGPISDDVKKRINSFLARPIENPLGKMWIKKEKEKRKS